MSSQDTADNTNTSSSSISGGPLSVVRLSRLHERVVQLREHLRAALLNDGPQLEMIVFTTLFDLYEHFYYDFFTARAAATTVDDGSTSDAKNSPPTASAVTPEARFVTASYTQDLLAACLYLIDADSLPSTCAIADVPPTAAAAHNADNASSVYVSKAQRHFCFLLFMFVCWSDASLPLKDVLHALYPLLDPGVPNHRDGSGSGADVASSTEKGPGGCAAAVENTIATDLFSQPRFAAQKRFIGETLSGLVLSRRHGVRSLLRVLLLDDRVESDTTADAAQLMVRLLRAPPAGVWLQSPVENTNLTGQGSAQRREYCVVREAALTTEAQIQRLAPQVLSLLEEHAKESSDGEQGEGSRNRSSGSRRDGRPRFLARLEAMHQRLPAETLEQRLHLFLTLYLNALVKLPARSSPDFPRCYRQFFYTNKYILSPGFACLSLRGDGPYTQNHVAAAVRRLTSLTKGVSLGAGTAVLSHVLPATAAGVLNLFALSLSDMNEEEGERSTKEHKNNNNYDATEVEVALRQLLLGLLSNPSLYELTAHAFVQACTSAADHSFRVLNAVERDVRYTDTACTAAELTRGFARLLFAMPLPAPDFVHVSVEALVDAAQLDLYATGIDTLTAPLPTVAEHGSITASETKRTSPPTSDLDASLPSSAASPPLVALLEQICLDAPSEAIFGTREHLSLLPTVNLLGRLLGLSIVLYRWAVGMLNALLRSDSVRLLLQHDVRRITQLPPQQQQGQQQLSLTASQSDPTEAAEEHRRFLSRFVRACQVISSTLQMLHPSGSHPPHAGAPPLTAGVTASLISEDTDLVASTAALAEALQACVTSAMQELNELSVNCAVTPAEHARSRNAAGAYRSANEVAVTLTAQWQRLWTQLQTALDGRASIDVAMTLTSLSRSVDDAVHDVADPSPLFPVVQPFLLTLTRVLYECDEVVCAVRAVHCLTWLAMYRFDSTDTAYVADIAWAVLGDETLPAWLAAQVGHTQPRAPAAVARVARLRVRLLDVLLALTDYDEAGRTLRNVDDVFRRTRHTDLFAVLVRLCHHTSDALVQVATLHLVGAYALAVYPRVPFPALCELCRDVFRLSPHEMAKAACAAALGRVVAALCETANSPASSSAAPPSKLLTEVDVEACQRLATAMASYRGRPLPADSTPSAPPSTPREAEVDLHDAVIQQHGQEMLRLLRSAALTWASSSEEATPSTLRVVKPNVRLP